MQAFRINVVVHFRASKNWTSGIVIVTEQNILHCYKITLKAKIKFSNVNKEVKVNVNTIKYRIVVPNSN